MSSFRALAPGSPRNAWQVPETRLTLQGLSEVPAAGGLRGHLEVDGLGGVYA